MKTTNENGPWDVVALDRLERWAPAMSEALEKVVNDPWSGTLDHKTVELVFVALNAACTSLNEHGTRQHIRNALAAGATRDELLTVLMMASLLSIHACSLGAPILLEEAQNAGVTATKKNATTPSCDRMRDAGQWNTAWDPFYAIDPAWTDAVMACGAAVYVGGVFEAKIVELLSIAFDASITHMYAPGVRRHIKAALAQGAAIDEIMDVLKLCVAHGVQALNMGVPILEQELSRAGGQSEAR